MEKSSTAFVRMDVHEQSIEVAIADGGRVVLRRVVKREELVQLVAD